MQQINFVGNLLMTRITNEIISKFVGNLLATEITNEIISKSINKL